MLRATLATAGAALLLGGCAAGHTAASVPVRHPAATAAAASRPAGDVKACVGVESLVSHLKVATVRWSPTRHPFDPGTATTISTFARELSAQAQFAQSARVARAVRENAVAFDALSRAMDRRRRTEVAGAIQGTRTHYRVLKAACSLE